MSWTSAILAKTPEERPFWPQRNWWLALLAILVLAGALRYPGYDFSLPYIDQPDEPNFILSGRMLIDFGTAKSLNNHFYPPGIIQIYYVVMRLFHDPATPPASAVGIVRLLAITTSLGIVVIIGLFGYHAVGEAAGLFGAAIWSISPLLVERSRWGTAEIWVVFFSLLALYFTIVAILYRRENWSTYATYALMLAIVFKYHSVFITPVVLLAPLWRRRVSGKRVLANLWRFALFSAWLLFLTPALEFLEPIPGQHADTWVRHTRAVSALSPRTLYQNFTDAFGWSGFLVFIPGWLGLGLLFWKRPISHKTRQALAFIFVALILLFLGVSIFGEQGPHAIRFLLPWVSLLVMLSGWGYAIILRELWQRLRGRPLLQQRTGMAGTLLLLGALFLPSLVDSVENMQWAFAEDPRNFVTAYMDRSLASGRFIINKGSSVTSRLFNREWGGYAGETAFELASFDQPTDFPVEHWRELEVDYVLLHYDVYDRLSEADPFDYLGQTTRLKGWYHQPNYRFSTMTVLLLQPIQHPATGQLGPIRLIGYDLTEESAQPGESLPFHLYWQATAATEADYQVFNHLLDADGNLVAQADGPPLPDPLLRRGTKDWHDPEEIIYSREYLLTLPEDLTPGEYTLVTGFYHRDSGQRLLSPTGEDTLWVTRIAVR